MPCAALSWSGAQTSAILPSPLSARRLPNQSPPWMVDGLMYACCTHVLPLRVKTYAAPLEVSEGWSLLPPSARPLTIPVQRQASSGEPTGLVAPSSLSMLDTPEE